MTSERAPVSVQRPIWYDSQQVDKTDLNAEQLANETIEASIIDNHVGDGILPEVLVNNIIFNSASFVGSLDGLPIFAQNQPTDNNFGNQLAINLTGSTASGKRQVKLCIIGLDFNNNLQLEIFYFDTNETQITRQHFTKVLLLLFQDFIGNPELSFNLGGTLIISEATPMTVSRDVIMIAQDQQPGLFWRDFFLDPSVPQLTVQTMIQAALPLYNTSILPIYTSALVAIPIFSGDVTTQIGQKFQATTNNIQKITLLLSVDSTSTYWTGDIIVSIYPLQVSLDCSTDLVPNLPIDYSPSNIPYAQISYNYTSLQAVGVVLNTIPQPVDFVFSNSPIAGGNVMSAGQYCAVTIKRSGASNTGNILISAGQALLSNSWVTTFSGSLWVDITNENLWFQVWTDAAKVTDGQAYDAGNGVTIPKTILDSTTQSTIDNIVGNIQFVGNEVFTAVLAAVTVDSIPVPDQRTGDPVDSRQQYEPQIILTDPIDLTNLEQTSTPLSLGSISDQNIKLFNPSNATFYAPLYSATVINDEIIIRIVDDPTDTYRFNSLDTALVSHLLMGDLVSAAITPDVSTPAESYRIASATLSSMIVGDVDGNGIIDENDLALLNTFIGFNLNKGLPLQTAITIDGYALTFTNGYATLNGSPINAYDGYLTATFVNGYDTLIQPFMMAGPIPWLLVNPINNVIIADGYDGVLQPNPNDFSLANFTSASVNFSNIIGLSSYNLVILSNGANMSNLGGWTIVGLDAVADVLTIQKIYLTGDVIEQMFRADINGDFAITYADGYLLENYIARLPTSEIPSPPYPAPTSNPYIKIGTRFNVIRLRLEEFVDRSDDYAANPNMRALTVHPVQNIFGNDGYLANHNYLSSPIQMSFVKQLVWEPSLVVSSSQSRLVPSIFTYETGFTVNSCSVEGVQNNVYPVTTSFDPGRVDFFIPNNLIIGTGGQLQTPAGDYYKVDFEVGTIILEIPDGIFGSERTIDIMGDFIATTVVNGVETGVTNLGFPAMRFADCSFVTADALLNDQIRFSVAVQSFSPNTNGLSSDGYYGAIVDGKMGVSIDFTTGLLTLNFTNLYQDPVLQTLSTKVQVNIFLKQGQFNNSPLFVDSTQVGNMLSLISVFSGANDGGPSAQVELGSDVAGVLPIINGGTGLNSFGAYGTVLTSTGSGISYQFITAASVNYVPAVPGNWINPPPTTVQQALDRIAAHFPGVL